MSTKTKVWLMIAVSFVLIVGFLFVGVMSTLNWVFTKLPMDKYETNTNATNTLYVNDSILAGVKRCYSEGYSRMVVEAGEYDIIQEYIAYYGDNYFVDYIDYWGGDPFTRGIWLEDIELVFSPGAKVKCHYTGNNPAVPDYFSPFAVGNNVTIDGLVMESSNVRYGIHPDFNTGMAMSRMVIKNCEFWHEKNAGNHQTIGCGFGLHVDWVFENCIFHTTKELPTVRIHNKGTEGAQSRALFKNCYIEGPGYFLFNHYGPSEKLSNIIVTGCSYVTPPQVGYETDADVVNMKLYAFNNEKRTN